MLVTEYGRADDVPRKAYDGEDDYRVGATDTENGNGLLDFRN